MLRRPEELGAFPGPYRSILAQDILRLSEGGIDVPFPLHQPPSRHGSGKGDGTGAGPWPALSGDA
jgi:hypothetical protein